MIELECLQVAEKKSALPEPKWWEQWKKAVKADDSMVSVDGTTRVLIQFYGNALKLGSVAVLCGT